MKLIQVAGKKKCGYRDRDRVCPLTIAVITDLSATTTYWDCGGFKCKLLEDMDDNLLRCDKCKTLWPDGIWIGGKR